MAVQEAIDHENPDAIVVARHDEQPHAVLDGVYGRLKEDGRLPVDAIYVGGGAAARTDWPGAYRSATRCW